MGEDVRIREIDTKLIEIMDMLDQTPVNDPVTRVLLKMVDCLSLLRSLAAGAYMKP